MRSPQAAIRAKRKRQARSDDAGENEPQLHTTPNDPDMRA
jgi:hypothetical protein